MKPDLFVTFAGIKMRNPVTTAAGTFEPTVFAQFVDPAQLGAILLKGTSLDPWVGNAPHRIVETPSGMLNTIGLQNPGVEAFIVEKLPKSTKYGVPVIVGVFDKTADSYARVIERLERVDGIAAYELNLSCPNLEAGGKTFCDHPELLLDVVQRARSVTERPIIAKLSPNVTDIVAVAQAAKAAGADGLSLINTLVGMRIDIESKRPVLSRNTGGLSGPAIRPVAVAKIFAVAQAKLGLPILGMGGIETAEDAIELMLAGANAVAVGTASFVNPRATLDVLEGIERYCVEHGIAAVRELTGEVVPN